ncbi:undecaprenyldiphospho-muramoylpentapeptide beta-N-acetylglucosaminyltransferase [Candidatus Schneideria nysicola]|uniref:undecaprenyldiphospho-muramoylpentapeptide beta-N-acetylglucosaminyltransferase n=1 Tax=Candidatus Schneideria nysicola TaxID=1081631 RepID=UPI001CAA6634|nr:undecaprenyldiphospho-muramoylpentapeptide beta-N-acetylglucosaminyltransferase [Candidatus Schneideria nysicola]UAJ65659.1 undecaprenyldiphospho-muramoylpentapeptide beta-N-acetylglucosaminyltransferase [Candidatus Schneideria nysicola]
MKNELTDRTHRCLIIIGGGTGGHIFPGLTIAQSMIEKGWKVRWIGTKDRMESYLVEKYGIHIDLIRFYGFDGKSLKTKLLYPIYIYRAVRTVQHIMCICKPDIVLGMGSYIAFPGILAAWIQDIPIVLHEQNAIAGRTNRLLSKIANKVLQAYPGTLLDATTVGNPIRKNILSLSLKDPYDRLINRSGPLRVLITGGSQGAKIFNKIMPLVFSRLAVKTIFFHQVGKGALHEIIQSYPTINACKNYILVEFIEDMATAYDWADIIICRSGALTVSEIATVGIPALFVPFIHKDRQQYYNARHLEKVGAAKIIDQKNFTVSNIIEILSGINRKNLLQMAQRARLVASFDATERVTREILSLVR